MNLLRNAPRATLISFALVLISLLAGLTQNLAEVRAPITSNEVLQRVRSSGENLNSQRCNLRVHEIFFQGVRNVGEVNGFGFFTTENDSGSLTLQGPDGRIWTQVNRNRNVLIEHSPDALKSRSIKVDQIPSPLNQSPGLDPLQIRDVYRTMSIVGLAQNGRTSFQEPSGSEILEFVEFDLTINSIGEFGTRSNSASWLKYSQLDYKTLRIAILWPINSQPVIKFDLPIVDQNELRASRVSIEASCIWQ